MLRDDWLMNSSAAALEVLLADDEKSLDSRVCHMVKPHFY
jgi:hypothetical protein